MKLVRTRLRDAFRVLALRVGAAKVDVRWVALRVAREERESCIVYVFLERLNFPSFVASFFFSFCDRCG
jgi:hypothetical protein